MSIESTPTPLISSSALLANELPPSTLSDLPALAGRCLRRWKLIVSIPLLGIIGVYGALSVVSPEYQSSVQILIFDPEAQRAASIARQRETQLEFDTISINTEIEVIKSAALLLRVTKALKLDEQFEFQKHSRATALYEWLAVVRDGWLWQRITDAFEATGFEAPSERRNNSESVTDSQESQARRTDEAAAMLRDHVRVDRIQFSYVLVISATSSSAQMAQRLAATVVNEYLAGQKEARREGLQQLAVWLDAKLAEMKTRVAETETAIETLKARGGFTDTGKGNVNDQKITELNAQLMLVRLEVADKHARLEQARQQASVGSTNQDAPESSTLSQLRVQQSLLTQREAQLRSQLGDRHAEVLAVGAQLARIKKAISDEAARSLSDLENGYDIAVRREQSLELSLQQLSIARGDSSDYVKLQQLQRIADADSKLYETYLSQYNEVGTRQSFDTPRERIIASAGLPNEPNFPRPKLYYILAGAVGVGFGALLSFLIELLHPGVTSGIQAERIFGYPVVGAIPSTRRQRSKRRSRDNGWLRAMASEPLSQFSEAVRAMRIGLRLSNLGERSRVILVTSCLPGEGKSTIATVLAASSAGAGLRTILVDCDLRGGTIGQYFETKEPGLTEILSGAARVDEVTFRDKTNGCHVIPSGSASISPGDLLISWRMRTLIEDLRQRYDCVVIDTAPLLSVADTLALVTLVDKILVIIDSSLARRDSLTEAFRMLRANTHGIFGLVFNKVDPKRLGRYGYGGYPY